MYEDILKGISNNLKAAIAKKIYQIHGIGLCDKVPSVYFDSGLGFVKLIEYNVVDG